MEMYINEKIEKEGEGQWQGQGQEQMKSEEKEMTYDDLLKYLNVT